MGGHTGAQASTPAPEHAHAHSHGHSHSHAHSHFPAAAGSAGGWKGVMLWSVAATFALVVAELVGGTLARSMALISDGIHNLSDVPTLLVSWFALRLAERPPDAEKTYGYHRAGILAAFANSLLLAAIAVFILYEAVERLLAPVAVAGAGMVLNLGGAPPGR